MSADVDQALAASDEGQDIEQGAAFVFASASAVPMTVIEPTRGWGRLQLSDLWRYRYLLLMLLLRDIKGRYRQTLLGPLWFALAPFASMVVLSFVFGKLAGLPSDGLPYPIFTYTALLPWTLFAGATQRSTGSLVSHMHIISKVYFPRLLVPVAASLSGLVDFGMSLLILLGMMVFYGFALMPRILVLPLLIALALALATGVGLWLASLTVRFRDIPNFLGYMIQFWFYVTPVAYSASLFIDWLPEQWHWLYWLNPMAGVVEGFRWALLDTGRAPNAILLVSALLAFSLFVSGVFVFRRTERSIVDLL